MIKNIIFDIGQVLAHFRWREYIEDLGFTGKDGERVANATVLGPYWNEVDRGVMTLQEVIEKCVGMDEEIEDKIRLFFKDRRTLVTEFDYSEGWLKELKSRGYKIYLLSNYSEDHFLYISTIFRFFGLEDGKVISYQEKVIKPDHKIYQILLDRYGLIPEECVFLDDSGKNVDAAIEMGIHGIQFLSYDQARSDLEKLLAK